MQSTFGMIILKFCFIWIFNFVFSNYPSYVPIYTTVTDTQCSEHHNNRHIYHPLTENIGKEKKILHPAQCIKRQLGVNLLFQLILYILTI